MLSLVSPDGHRDRSDSIPCELGGFRVSAEQRGAEGGRGGDFCTLAVRAPGRVGIVIGDACGRGADGEAQLARIFPKIRELALSGTTPARMLSELNRTVIDELPLDRFVTAAALELDLRAGVLTVANAAHVPAIVRRAGRASIVGRASGAPLGFSDKTTYVDEHRSLVRGDVIVLMTDGVLEAVEVNLSTMSTLRTLLANTTVGAESVFQRLLQLFEECTLGRCADDMTLLALEPIGYARPSKASARRLYDNLLAALERRPQEAA